MSWGATTASPICRASCIGMLLAISFVLNSSACFGQQTSRRNTPKSDENTKADSNADFSGVNYRTPRITLKSDVTTGDSDLIPVSGSSRRSLANVAANLQDDSRQEVQLAPTLSPDTRVAPLQLNSTSARRIPTGSDSAIAADGIELSDELSASSRVARLPATRSGEQQLVSNRMDFVQPFSDQPFAQPPIVSVDQFTSPSAGSVADSVGNIQLKDAAQYLSRKPEFQNPKKYLAQPARPSRQAINASTSGRNSPKMYNEPMGRTARRYGQAETLQSNAMARTAARPFTANQTKQDDSGLGEFADINASISPVPLALIAQYDPDNLLGASPLDSKALYQGDLLNYTQLTGSVSVPCGKAWLAPNFYHRPLYFEETNLERYGNRLPMQVVASAAHFFVTLPIIPYKMGANPPYQCTYTYGHQRPGDCVPYQIHRLPFSVKGGLNQALITTAIVVP